MNSVRLQMLAMAMLSGHIVDPLDDSPGYRLPRTEPRPPRTDSPKQMRDRRRKARLEAIRGRR